MMYSMKKFLALILSIALVLAVVVIPAIAEEECLHDGAKDRMDSETRTTYEDNEDGTHDIICAEYVKWECVDCGKDFWKMESETDRQTEAHTFVNGVCTKCGALCDHGGSPIGTVKSCTDNQDGTHSGIFYNLVRCNTCGLEYRDESKFGDIVNEKHSYNEEHVCAVCGAECPHTNKDFNLDRGYVTGYEDNHDGSTHTVIETCYQYWTCLDCYDHGSSVCGDTEQKIEEHSFNAESVCTKCKYTCTHSHKLETPYYEPYTVGDDEHIEWTDNEDGTHSTRAKLTVEWECSDCGVKGTEVEEDATLTEKHEYKNGVCVKCQAKKPAPVPTAVPTSVSTPVSADAEVAKAMIDNAIQVEILGSDKLMTEEEYTAMQNLIFTERLHIVLSAIGLDDAADAVLEEAGMSLSENAATLLEAVLSRIDGLPEDELKAFAEQTFESFPMIMVKTEDGELMFRVFTCRIVIEEDATDYYFGFRQDENGKWICVEFDKDELLEATQVFEEA